MSRTARTSLALLLVLALTVGPSAFALPQTATIEGRVFQDDLRTPAADLDVQALVEGSDESAASARTDERGRFSLAGVPAGEIFIVLTDSEGHRVGASRIDTRAVAAQPLTLALPSPEAALAPAQAGDGDEGGFWRWVSTPVGATVALLVVGGGVAVLVDEVLDDEDTVEDREVASEVLVR